MTMRVDLPPARQEAASARLMAAHAQRAGATSAVLVVYDDTTPTRSDARWRGASLARTMRIALRQRGGLRLDEALAVRAGRWRSLLCGDEGCCPPSGLALPAPDAPSAAAAALAVAGAAVLPDREALVASVAAPSGDRAAALALLARRLGGPVGGPQAVERFRAALAARRDGAGPSDEDAVRLARSLADVGTRDVVLSWAAWSDTDALLALLLDLSRAIGPPHDAPALATLAWVAYARGDGTLANVAVERALATDPTHSLSLLIASGLDAGLHPEHLRRVSREVAGEVAASIGRRMPGPGD